MIDQTPLRPVLERPTWNDDTGNAQQFEYRRSSGHVPCRNFRIGEVLLITKMVGPAAMGKGGLRRQIRWAHSRLGTICARDEAPMIHIPLFLFLSILPKLRAFSFVSPCCLLLPRRCQINKGAKLTRIRVRVCYQANPRDGPSHAE